MKKEVIMKIFNIAATIFGLVLSLSVSAHTSLKQSTPAQDAMLMQSPEQLTLTFSGDVRLAKVTLKDSANQAVDFDFKPSATANSHFSWDLPSLTAGKYKVDWVILGGDGHKMSGAFNFMLHGSDAHSKMMPEPAKSQKNHNH